MLSTVAGVTFIATLFMVYRNIKQYDAYHRAHVTRTQLVNQIFMTLLVGGLTIALFVLGRLF